MRAVRGVSKTLAAAFVVLLLAVGLAACGDDDSSNGSTEATSQAGAGSDDAGSGQDATSEDSGSGGGDAASDAEKAQARNEANDFVPKKHKDSGGGSAQFKVKGGDNSVQEFGEEAEAEEFDAAAVALHNFLDARAEGNWAAACQYMAKSIVESFEQLAARAKQIDDTTCAGILEKLTNPAAKQSMKEEAAKANVGSLRIEGEQAFVIYGGLDGAIMAMPMADEGGEWKVGSLAGTPLN